MFLSVASFLVRLDLTTTPALELGLLVVLLVVQVQGQGLLVVLFALVQRLSLGLIGAES